MPPSLKRRLLTGGFWVVVGKAATASSRLIATGLLARLLTQEALGAFGLAFSFITAGSLAAQFGLQQAVVRLVAESLGSDRPGRARAAIRLVFRYCSVANVIVAAIVLLGGGSWIALALWDSPLLAASMTGLVLWIALWSFQILSSETFRGFQDLRAATIFGGVISWVLVAALLGVVWLIEAEISFNGVILLFIGTTAISLAAALFFLGRRVKQLPAAEPLAAGEVLSISMPLGVNLLTAFALAQASMWILGAFIPKDEVAVYFAATQLVTLVQMSLMLVNLVVPPFIAELYSRGEVRRLERILRMTATVAGLPALAALLAFMFYGGPILALVFSEPYAAGATVLGLLSLGKLVNVFTGSCGITMSMTGHQTVLMVITLIASSLTVAGCLLVVRPYGMLGVAAVVCAGTILQNIAMWLGTRYFTGMWTHLGLPGRQDLRSLLGS